MTPEQQGYVRQTLMPHWQQLPPPRRQAILQSLHSLRDLSESDREAKLNDPNFNTRMRGQGIWADQIKTMFAAGKKRSGLDQRKVPGMSTAAFVNVGQKQMMLW